MRLIVAVCVCALSLLFYFFLQQPYLSPSVVTLSSSSPTPNLAVVTLREGEISLSPTPIPEVPYGKVLIRVNYAPINPSDAYRALGSYKIEGIDADEYPHLNGFEGSGVVVGSGGGIFASLLAYLNVHVAFILPQCGSWSRFVVGDPMEMFPLSFAGVSDINGSAAFVNPMTVVGMLEVAKQGGHRAVVHTAASSSLGLMLLRAAPLYNVTLLTVVRGERNEEILKTKMHHPSHLIVRSDLPEYPERLRSAIASVGATLAFDAIGGQSSSILYHAMPSVSTTYVYGRLGGEKEPDSLYEMSTPQKSFKFFHLKHWIDEGGIMRMLATGDTVTRLLSNELATEFDRILDFDETVIEEIKKYSAHQKGGKMVIRMWPDLTE